MLFIMFVAPILFEVLQGILSKPCASIGQMRYSNGLNFCKLLFINWLRIFSAHKSGLALATTTSINTPYIVSFVEKMPPMTKNSTNEPEDETVRNIHFYSRYGLPGMPESISKLGARIIKMT